MATFTLSSGAVIEIADILYDFLQNEAVKDTSWTADQLVTILPGQLIVEAPSAQPLRVPPGSRVTLTFTFRNQSNARAQLEMLAFPYRWQRTDQGNNPEHCAHSGRG